MSRISDTRLRTRDAAVRLVAAGRRPYELTVDLIYAEIKQGSRTTINDELKLWKDEQAKVDALSAALPPVVANAMLSAWAVAVEYGEKVFDDRREEVEGELVRVLERITPLETENARLQNEVVTLKEKIDTLRRELTNEFSARETAQAQAENLAQQLESLQIESEQRRAAEKAEYQKQIIDLQAAMETQEKTFRTEIDKATERLEGVQKHVMLQIVEAREAHKRAETQLMQSHQKNEKLVLEIQELQIKLASLAHIKNQTQQDIEKLANETAQLRTERESFIIEIATVSGKLSAQIEQIQSLEQRAIHAETRLEDVLKQRAKNEDSRN